MVEHQSKASHDDVWLLKVRDLSVEFGRGTDRVRAVRSMAFEVRKNAAVGVVGESGSGKSVTALALLGLLPPGGTVTGGSAMFGEVDLLKQTESQLGLIRGRQIALVFQDPVRALNPALTVGFQMREVIRAHDHSLSRADILARSVELLRSVGVSDAQRRLRQYPYEFSGGMAQRVVIAMALGSSVRLFIADEPTTALDVTIQAQIMDLFRELRARVGTSLVLISHDLGLVASAVEFVFVMYGGRLVEQGPVETVFDQPAHPYTQALLEGAPRLGQSRGELRPIVGDPPDPTQELPGCAFEPRCPVGRGRRICITTRPPLFRLGDQRASACHFVDDVRSTHTDG